MTKKVTKCANCKRRLSHPKRGRRRLYCSHSCRQRAYERRKYTDQIPLALLRRDIDQMASKAGIERAVVEVLQRLGMLPKLPTPQLPPIKLVSSREDDEDDPSV